MEKRQLGGSDLMIAPIIFGGNVFGWTIDDAQSQLLLDAFLDRGCNAIDTADAYADNESERVIGRWLKRSGKRGQAVITSKVGIGPNRTGISAGNIIAACEDSLNRLQTDYIDIYELHCDFAGVQVEEFLTALDILVKDGKVRVIGVSNFGVKRLKDSLDFSAKKGLPRFHVLQPEYSLMYRGIEKDIMPFCHDRNIAITPYFSLASGYLTGKYRNEADKAKSVRGARMGRYMEQGGPAVLAALDDAAARHGASLAQVALAWLMARPGIAAPIASATSLTQLDDLIGAAHLKLTQEDMAALDAVSAPSLDAAPFYG